LLERILGTVAQMFEYGLLSYFDVLLIHDEILVSLQLFTQGSDSMGLAAPVFSLNDNIEWLLSSIIFGCEEEVLDLIVNLIDELLIADEWVGILSVVHCLLDYQRIVMQLQEYLRWDDLAVIPAVGAFGDSPLFKRVYWLEDGNTDGLALELAMLSIFEGDLVHCFVFGPQIAVDFASALGLHRPIHDSCCQVDRVTETRELFSAA
jgi:hypothetical protein